LDGDFPLDAFTNVGHHNFSGSGSTTRPQFFADEIHRFRKPWMVGVADAKVSRQPMPVSQALLGNVHSEQNLC